MSSPSSQRKTRLNCRIDKDLLEWVKWYAAQQHITVTQIVVNFLRDLRRKSERGGLHDVDQL